MSKRKEDTKKEISIKNEFTKMSDKKPLSTAINNILQKELKWLTQR